MDSDQRDYLREQIKVLTENYIKSGGKIKRESIRPITTIDFKGIVKKYNVDSDSLIETIRKGKFVTSNTANNGMVRAENMVWFSHNVQTWFEARGGEL